MEIESPSAPTEVRFKCVKQGSRLRVRITTPGYNNGANCQFPRKIRKEGATYSAPSSAIKFARGPAGKFFYRVSASQVSVLSGVDKSSLPAAKITIEKIYKEESPECVVCFDAEHDVVIVPCGHYCLCKGCASTIQASTNKCPMCRGNMDMFVTEDMIAT